MQVVLCSFAGGGDNYRSAITRLKIEAKNSNLFDRIYCFTDLDAPTIISDEIERRKDFYKNRGFGYWSWKSLLVSYILDETQIGDIIFYVDAGCQISPYSSRRFAQYIDYINKNIYLFFHMPPHIEESFTSKKIIERLSPDPSLLKSPQIQATFFGFKNTLHSKCLFEEWKNISLFNNGFFIDDNNVVPISNKFIDYRHDQSILSIIVKNNGIPTTPYECHHSSIDYYPNSPILQFPIHSVRNCSGITKDQHAFIKSSYYITNSNHIIYTPIKLAFLILYLFPKFFRFLKNRL